MSIPSFQILVRLTFREREAVEMPHQVCLCHLQHPSTPRTGRVTEARHIFLVSTTLV
jgi:hypothetical protein